MSLNYRFEYYSDVTFDFDFGFRLYFQVNYLS